MRTIKDRTGQEWDIDITVGSIDRVKDITKIDLLDIMTTKGLLTDDWRPFLDVIYGFCRPQSESRGMTREQFLDLWDGEAVEQAKALIINGWIDFSPARTRQNLRTIRDKAMSAQSRLLEAATKMIHGGELDRILDETVISFAGSFGSSPASSESIPASSPGAS